MSENAFKYSILASSSTRNPFYVETPRKRFLIDMDLTGEKITNLLAEIDCKPEDSDAIFIIHEHSDYIKEVGVLVRRYNLDVYTSERTWQMIDERNMIGELDLAQKHIFERGETLTLGDTDIESFGVSHGAIEPQFYRLMRNNKLFVVLTDTGYVSNRMTGIIENADGYSIESNRDVEILRSGSYPRSLKQRTLSDKGHLSNEDGAGTMIRTIGNCTKKIYLGHLSKESNIKELAHMTMENNLIQADFGVGYDMKVFDASPDEAAPLTGL